MLSRYALDYLYPVPFILGWLLCLLIFLDTDRIAMLVAATALLGVGFYSYIAAVVMMPLYFVLTCWVLWSRPRRSSSLAVAAIGFRRAAPDSDSVARQPPDRLRGYRQPLQPVLHQGAEAQAAQ